jgi:hypothetical protein
MGLKSQRKGRAAEHEIRDDFKAHGIKAETNGIYEAHDVTIWLDELPEQVEVKRKAKGWAVEYDCLDNGAKIVVKRADRKRWLATVDFVFLLALLNISEASPFTTWGDEE